MTGLEAEQFLFQERKTAQCSLSITAMSHYFELQFASFLVGWPVG